MLFLSACDSCDRSPAYYFAASHAMGVLSQTATHASIAKHAAAQSVTCCVVPKQMTAWAQLHAGCHTSHKLALHVAHSTSAQE